MARPSQRIITFYSGQFKIQPKIKLLSRHRVQRNFFLHLIFNLQFKDRKKYSKSPCCPLFVFNLCRLFLKINFVNMKIKQNTFSKPKSKDKSVFAVWDKSKLWINQKDKVSIEELTEGFHTTVIRGTWFFFHPIFQTIFFFFFFFFLVVY